MDESSHPAASAAAAPASAAAAPASPGGWDRLAFLWIATLGVVCATVLFGLAKTPAAEAIITLTVGILGMMGWRQAQPIPAGGASLVLSAPALARSGLSDQFQRERLLAALGEAPEAEAEGPRGRGSVGARGREDGR